MTQVAPSALTSTANTVAQGSSSHCECSVAWFCHTLLAASTFPTICARLAADKAVTLFVTCMTCLVWCVAVSQTFGGNALLFYWIMLGNSALAGTWMLHLAKFLWETVFERLIFHNQAEPARVRSLYQPAARNTYARHTLAMPAAHIALKWPQWAYTVLEQRARWHSSLKRPAWACRLRLDAASLEPVASPRACLGLRAGGAGAVRSRCDSQPVL